MSDLTPKQTQILALVADGLQYQAISRRLGNAEMSSRKLMAEVRTRLGASTNAHAVAIAYRTGVLPQDLS